MDTLAPLPENRKKPVPEKATSVFVFFPLRQGP